MSCTNFIVPFALYVVLQKRKTKQRRLGGVTPLVDGTLPSSANEDGSQGSSDYSYLESPMLDAKTEAQRVQHDAFPKGLGGLFDSSGNRIAIASGFGLSLAVAAIAAIYLSIDQGTYAFDQQTCALVGQ